MVYSPHRWRGAATRPEYLDPLARAIRGDRPLQGQPGQAGLAMLLSYPVCHRVGTAFTPQPMDFIEEVPANARLLASAKVPDRLAAIDQNIPLALIRHRRNGKARR